MYPGANMSIGYPFKVYLTMESTAIINDQVNEISDFRFDVRYNKFDPNASN
jgi:hypothetical protein